MAGRDTRHARRAGDRFLLWFPAALVLVLLLSALASWQLDLGDRLGIAAPDPRTDPAAVEPPPGLTLPEPPSPSPVAAANDVARIDPARVRRALARKLADPDLGRHVLAAVASLDGGTRVLEHGSGVATPASTMKLLTSTAALATLGPDHTFTTKVVTDAPGRIVLVGGGDPYLASKPVTDAAAYPHRADVVTLARETARALRKDGTRKVRVGYDATLFSGPRVDPHWPADYVPDGVVAPITSLWVDEGRPASGIGRVADPAATAATAFTAALRRAGVRVVGTPKPHRAGAEAPPVASVESAPLSQVVEEILSVSDNEGAEVLGHQVGLATGGAGSFADGARGVLRVLRSLDVPLDGAVVHDGSGLSREDRLDPDTLAAVLALAASDDHPELRAVVTGLPVAGFSGSLETRFANGAPEGRGRVRAKTGTLTGVSSLAGVATDLDGNPMVFVLMADKVALPDTLDARDALDTAAAALGACHCGARGR